MNAEEKIKELRGQCDTFYKQAHQERQSIQKKLHDVQVQDEEHKSLQRTSHELKWRLRDIFELSHRLDILDRVDSILYIDGRYDSEEERLKRFREYILNDLVVMVMGEDTLHFSTSPESNMYERARYKAMRTVHRWFKTKV